MRFASPEWLWYLLLLPVAFGVSLYLQARKRRRFARFADESLWSTLAPELNWSARIRKTAIWLVALGFALLALARPQWGKVEEVLKMSGLDIMIALDVSNSMEVEDVVPSRLKKARHVIRTLLNELDGDRVGVVAFAGSSYVAAPLTTDLGYIQDTIEILGPSTITNQGTDVGTALETAARALDRGAQDEATKGETQKSSRVIVLLSDGEDHEKVAIEAARKLKEAGILVYVLGIGTEKGGPVPLRDREGQLHGFKRGTDGSPVISSYKPDFLTKVAAEAGGKYWTVTSSETEVNDVLEELGTLTRSDFAERRVVTHQDRFQLPLAFAVLLLLLETSLSARARRPRVQGAAAMLVAGASLLIITTGEARAAGLKTWVENKEGLEAYKAGKIDEAKKRFGTAQALDPALPELQYNQGVVELQTGDAEKAAAALESAASGAVASNKQELAANAYLNQGVALDKSGDTEGALQAYLKSLDLAKLTGNQALQADARKNIERTIEQRQKQQQQQDQQEKSDQQQDQQNQQDQQQKQGQDQKEEGQEKKDKQGQKQAERFKDPSQRRGGKGNFKSEKLSKEDAERVMAELSSRERELQAKLRKQKGNPAATEKDW